MGLVASASIRGADSLHFVPEEGLSRRKSFEIDFGLGGGWRLSERLVIDEELLAIDGGRATRFSRTIVDLRGQSSSELTGLAGVVAGIVVRDVSPAEGVTFVFEWDHEDRAYSIREEHGRGDPRWVDGLDEGSELTEFLPQGPVEVGDSWHIAPSALACLLRPGGRLPSYDDDRAEVHRDALLRSLDGEVLATYLGVRARTDGTYAVIQIDVEIEGRLRTTLRDGNFVLEWDDVLVLDLEGELRWDLSAGRLHDLELSGTARLRVGFYSALEGSVRLAVEVDER